MSASQEGEELSGNVYPLVQIIAPYLAKSANNDEVGKTLENVGVETFQDMQHLQYNDIKEFMTPIAFRKMLAEIKNGLPGASASSGENGGGQRAASYQIPKTLFPKRLLKRLKKTARLPKDYRLKLVQIVADDLYDNYSRITKDLSQTAARALCNTYSDALGGKYSSTVADLAKQLLFRARFQMSKDRRRSSKQLPRQTRRKSILGGNSHGVPKDVSLPNVLPEGETQVTQEKKRAELQEMFAVVEKDWQKIDRLMISTFASQRASIEELLDMDERLQLWPFLGKYKNLRKHFYCLMRITEEDYVSRMSDILPKLEDFFKAEGNATRKGGGAAISKQLRKILRAYEAGERDGKHQLVSLTLCVCCYLNQDLDQLFLEFDETTSYDEIQASPRLPKDGNPIIAMLGNDHLKCLCFVVVDKRILYPEKLSICAGLLAVFMSYFVFSIKYPTKLMGLLQFYERQLFGINANVEDARLNSKYLLLMRRFEDYVAKWGPEGEQDDCDSPGEA